MTTKLIYHTVESIGGGISPFDETIRSITSNQEISIACPYLSIDYLEVILSYCKSWRIVSDVEAWIISHNGNSRKKIVDFIIRNNERIHHYKNLHAKVIITEKNALIGSANFTKMGILERIEMAVLIETEFQINELNKWFDNLWSQSQTVESDELQNYLKIIPDKIRTEEDYTQPVLHSNAPKVVAKLAGRIERIKNNKLTNNMLHSEKEALDIIIKNNKMNGFYNDILKVFKMVKNNIPYDLRESISFRTDKRRIQISFIIQNYLIFRLPSYDDDKSYKGEEINTSVYIIYPKDDVGNLKTIIAAADRLKLINEQGTFAFFDCTNIRLRYNEILQFSDIHWKSFIKACYMAKEARKTRNWDTNIKIIWQ